MRDWRPTYYGLDAEDEAVIDEILGGQKPPPVKPFMDFGGYTLDFNTWDAGSDRVGWQGGRQAPPENEN